jgi:poly(3-hydroxyalkanoate) depolymerase
VIFTGEPKEFQNMHSREEAVRPEGVRVITVNNQRLRVAIRPGNGSRNPLLLMNGIGVNLELLQVFVDALDPAREVIRFDVPGIGGSPSPAMPYTFLSLAHLVAQMLDHLGYTQVDVLGVSWGGALAQQFALQHGSRCRRLILASTSTGMTMIPGRLDALTRMATPRSYTEPSYLKEADPDLSSEGLQWESEVVREAAPALRLGGSRGYLYQMLAGMGWTSLPWLCLIRQPTLILAGNEDPILPPINAKIMHRLIPRAKLYIFSGGHMGLLTHSRELAHVVEQFLTNR